MSGEVCVAIKERLQYENITVHLVGMFEEEAIAEDFLDLTLVSQSNVSGMQRFVEKNSPKKLIDTNGIACKLNCVTAQIC